MSAAACQAQDFVCAVCAGEAGFVHVDRYHVCDDPRCAEVAKAWASRVNHETIEGASQYEGEAMIAAGRAAGQFLSREVGATDLGSLTRDQYRQFTKTMIETYRSELQRLGASGAPPF